MSVFISLPARKESVLAIGITVLFFLLTGWFVGLRSEHFLIIGILLCLFFFNDETRKLVVAIIPFAVFGASYDWMRVYPNYTVNPIDVENLYDLENLLFGITVDGEKLIPSEYFAIHNNTVVDLLAGIFYLGWVPIPFAFGIYLYLKKERRVYLRFALVFLFVNLIGFAGYYIHPAAPPWYVMDYGIEPILNTPGNMGGLARFDELVGIPVFNWIYGRNSNVFAAVPSLHSAYLVVTLYYALQRKTGPLLLSVLIIFMLGIWFTAVYSSHHYIIDVILGVLCALLGIALFEKGLMKLKRFRSFFSKYYDYINMS